MSCGKFNPGPQRPRWVAREVDRVAVDSLMRLHRLVTVTGAGGIGKTAVAKAVMDDWMGEDRHAVRLDMAGPDAAQTLATAIAGHVHWPLGAQTTLLHLLRKFGMMREVLMVIDSAQAQLPCVRDALREVLATRGSLRFLVTSRVGLKLDGERVMRMRPLVQPTAEWTAATLADMWDWSYQHLSRTDKQLFRKLGTVEGEFTLKRACDLCGCDDEWSLMEPLGRLVDQSLVLADSSDPPRFRMPDSVRRYAATIGQAGAGAG